MAIFHFHAKIMTRAKGHSAVAAAAYRSGEILWDERADMVHDYHNRSGVVHSAILTPDHAPEWMQDRQKLWNEVEKGEKRKKAQLVREVEVSLPRDLSLEDNQELIQEFIKENFVKAGMVADINIHNDFAADGGENPHAHVLLTMRDIKGDGFGNKNRGWNDRNLFMKWRESWATFANRYLSRAGSSERIDHRTLVDQGIDRTPTFHLGKDVTAMEAKGVETEIGDRHRAIVMNNTVAVINHSVRLAGEELVSNLAAEQARRGRMHAEEADMEQERELEEPELELEPYIHDQPEIEGGFDHAR